MAICDDCKQEMTVAAGCTLETIVIEDEPMTRIRCGAEGRHYGPPSKLRCHDCGVWPGQLHHLGCHWERCPGCGRQLITCGCLDDEEADDWDDEDPGPYAYN